MQALSDVQAEVRESSDGEPSRVVESQEASGQVIQALALLPDNQQEVIRLRFQNGLSYKDIAAVMNLSVSNVGYLIHTAIKSIRETLNVKPGTEPRL